MMTSAITSILKKHFKYCDVVSKVNLFMSNDQNKIKHSKKSICLLVEVKHGGEQRQPLCVCDTT